MATPAKRRVMENDLENYNSSESDDRNENTTIYVQFEGRNPEVTDFHGIKILLEQLFLKTNIDLSALADVIISNQYVGSVLEQSEDIEGMEDDDDNDVNMVFGITTVLNLNEDKQCLGELKKLLLNLSEAYANDTTYAFLTGILEDESAKLGLLINERFMNIPAQIFIPLCKNLVSEVDEAVQRDESYNFSYYVMICKLYKNNSNQEQSIFWSNPEEEIFAEESQYSFEFSVEDECDKAFTGAWSEIDDTLIPYRKVLIFESSKLPSIIAKIESQF